jgi:hypothetical protein
MSALLSKADIAELRRHVRADFVAEVRCKLFCWVGLRDPLTYIPYVISQARAALPSNKRSSKLITTELNARRFRRERAF